jgi:hypothetical protein
VLELRYHPVPLPKLNVALTNKFLRRLTSLGIIGAFQIQRGLEVAVCADEVEAVFGHLLLLPMIRALATLTLEQKPVRPILSGAQRPLKCMSGSRLWRFLNSGGPEERGTM